LTPENNSYQAKKDSYDIKQFTPEYTITDAPNLDKVNHYFLSSTKQAETEIPCEDPDVTQLEIDINSASLTPSTTLSQNNTSKKRQLINMSENLKDYSIVSDVIAHSSQNEI
jgi:hypothetical protein